MNQGQQADQPNSETPLPACLTDEFIHRVRQLQRLIAGMGFAAADAEDILQDVFIQASQYRGEPLRSDESARWLMRVSVNRCLLEFRRRKRFRLAIEQLQRRLAAGSPASCSAVEASISAEELRAVHEALEELSEPLLTPLVLRYFCGLDSGEVGEILEMPASTVRSRLRDARLILARRLMERGVKP